MTDTDILISGGGVAGLSAAAAFGAAGFRVICVEPVAPVTDEGGEGADLRTTALLQPAARLLEQAGLWQALLPHAASLSVMRIVDAGGREPVARLTRDFTASDISDLPFGWNVPNWLLRRELLAAIQRLPNVSFRPGIGTSGLHTRTAGALVILTDGSRIGAKLVVAADGRSSPMRQAAGIAVHTTRYGQKALAFAVSHPVPHENISTEVHRSGGPFTLVPLPDRNGLPCSAVVWMEHGPEAHRLASLPIPEFEAAMTERSAGVNGPLKLLTRRSLWPIIGQTADRMTSERLALIAEAAHVVPPIGAQGLNMTLRDLAELLDLAVAHQADPGSRAVLAEYERRRSRDVHLRALGIDLLNRASMIEAQPLRDLRAGLLGALYSATPVRRGLMRAGLGVSASESPQRKTSG